MNTTEFVSQILTEEDDSRNSDHVLYYYVCGDILWNKGIDIDKVDFARMFLHPDKNGLPQFESVSRARRKLQHDFPELAGNAQVSMQRSMNADAVRAVMMGV